jgi:hypothetical protein
MLTFLYLIFFNFFFGDKQKGKQKQTVSALAKMIDFIREDFLPPKKT